MADSPVTSRISLLSPAEFRIFSVVSRRGPLTIEEVRSRLAQIDPNFRQGYNTVGTLLKRLVQKNYVEQRDVGLTAHLFRSTVPYDLALSWHVERFLEDLLISSRADLRVVLGVVADRLAAAKW